MSNAFHFHPTPGSPASPMSYHFYPRFRSLAGQWPLLRADLATQLGCSLSALDIEDVTWGGVNNDDDRADVVTLAGEIIGSIGRELTSDDMAAINGEIERRAA